MSEPDPRHSRAGGNPGQDDDGAKARGRHSRAGGNPEGARHRVLRTANDGSEVRDVLDSRLRGNDGGQVFRLRESDGERVGQVKSIGSAHFSGENASGAHSVETIFVRLAGPPTGGQTPCLTASARIWARASTLS